MQVMWFPGKTLEQLNVEAVKAAMIHFREKKIAAQSLGIDENTIQEMLDQITKDEEAQSAMNKRLASKRTADLKRLRGPSISHSGPIFDKKIGDIESEPLQVVTGEVSHGLSAAEQKEVLPTKAMPMKPNKYNQKPSGPAKTKIMP